MKCPDLDIFNQTGKAGGGAIKMVVGVVVVVGVGRSCCRGDGADCGAASCLALAADDFGH